jgi:hypothetical protein
MSDPTKPTAVAQRPPLPIGKIVFDLFLLAVVGTLVVSALSLRPAAGFVPLLVGIPTTIALLVRLVLDVLRRGKDYRPAVVAQQEADHELDAEELATASISDLTRAARAEIEEEGHTTPEEERRQRIFAVWGIAYVALSTALTVFILPLPGLHTWFVPVALVALIVIFRIIRLGWVRAILISAILTGAMYGLLVLFLGVRL